jgi:hypothetical protein
LRRTREKGVSIKEGLRPNEPNIFRFSFYFGLFIFSLFFLRTTEKGFFLSKQSFENSFIIKRFCNSYQKVLQLISKGFQILWILFFFVFGGTREKVFDQGGLRPHEPKVLQILFLFWGVYFLFVF